MIRNIFKTDMRKNLLMAFTALIVFPFALSAQNTSFGSLMLNHEVPAVGQPKAASILMVKDLSQSAYFCGSDFAQTKEECDALSFWGPENLSSPNNLDREEEFKIVFHSITGFVDTEAYDENYKEDWPYKLLTNPQLIKNNPRISASLISEKKHSTFNGTIGFILEVPKENLAGMSGGDMGTGYYSYGELIYSSKLKYWDILSPERLLEETRLGDYNEIVLIGTHPHSKTSVKVVGIIIDCPVDKTIKLNDYSTEEFNELTNRCDLSRGLKYTIPLIDKLRKTLPVYAFSVF